MSAFDEMCRIDPAFALELGVMDGKLPPGRATFPLERLAAMRALTLPADEPDVEHFKHCIELEAFALLELGERLKNPDSVSPLVQWFATLYYAPFSYDEERKDILAGFLREVPFYLAEAITTIGEPDSLWRDLAVEAAQNAPEPLQLPAMKDYVRALKAAHIKEKSRFIDRDTFNKLLSLKRITFDLRDIEELGRERIAHLSEKREQLSKELSGFPDSKNAARATESDGPATVADFKVAIREARDFCGEYALAPMPKDDEVVIIDAPFSISPKPRWPLQRSIISGVAIGSRPRMFNLAVAEGYPGRHLQAAVANQRGSLWRNAPWTTARSARMGDDTISGWAHYAEAFMKAKGFYTSPTERFQTCNDALLRAHQVILDIELATGAVTLETAAQRLVDAVHLPAAAAMTEARQMTLTPGSNLSAAIGKHVIRDLRTEAKRLWDRGFSHERFHELIVTNGRAALSHVRKRL